MKPSNNTGSSQLGMRKPVVNPTEQRKRFLVLAEQLHKGIPLSAEQIEYLASGFERIGNGESSDAVFHLKRNRGQKIDNEEHRRKMSLVFVQIAHYIASPDGRPKGEGLTLKEAFEKLHLLRGRSLAKIKIRKTTLQSISTKFGMTLHIST
jgi:hypothetical protein